MFPAAEQALRGLFGQQQQIQQQQKQAPAPPPSRLAFHPLHRGDQAALLLAPAPPAALPLAAIIPGDSVAEQVLTSGLDSFLQLYNSALIVRLVLTWFPSVPEAILSPLATLCDPYLNLFRGVIPPLGGTLDLSPILAFLVLSVFTNTAAALPCEGNAAAAEGAAAVRAARRQLQAGGSGSGAAGVWAAPRCGSVYQRAWDRRVAATRQVRAMRQRVERAAACEDGRAAC
jgi:YggT family protein